MVVYNGSGTNPVYYKDEYDIFTQKHGADKPTPEWRIEYYNNNNEKYPNEEEWSEEKIEQYKLDFNFLPKLEEKKLIPSNLFIDFSKSDIKWIPYVICD
jgi:hypothetical protein